LLEELGVHRDCILKTPTIWKHAAGFPWIARLSALNLPKYDMAICAFPPPFYRELSRSGIAKKVLLVAGHRIDLGIKTEAKRRNYFNKTSQQTASGELHLAAMNPYDAAYIEHEIGLKVDTLGCCRYDLLDIAKRNPPAKRTTQTLIGPSHVLENSLYSDLIESYKASVPDIVPRTIKSLYPRYTYQQLAAHSSCVVLPYSIFSISIDELFALGLRLLIPSNRLLNQYGALNDVKLWPIYTTRENAAQFANKDSLDNPNCTQDGISETWLQHASWNKRSGTMRWDNFDELKDQLNEDATRHVFLNIENEHRRAKAQTEAWTKKIDQVLSS
jgi:hypothetical protein